MDYDTLLPSEVDRLIYGYLEEENCAKTASCFLQESENLSECQAVVLQGKHFSTKVNGFKLTDIIDAYYGMRYAVMKKMEELESIKEKVVDVNFLSNILNQFGCGSSNQNKIQKLELGKYLTDQNSKNNDVTPCDDFGNTNKHNHKNSSNSKCTIDSSIADLIVEENNNLPIQSLSPLKPIKNIDFPKSSMNLSNANASEIIDELMSLEKDSSSFSAYINNTCNKYFSLESIAIQSPMKIDKTPLSEGNIDLTYEYRESESLVTNQMKRSNSMDNLMFDVAEEYVIAEDSKLNRSSNREILCDDKDSKSNESSIFNFSHTNITAKQSLDNLFPDIQKNTNTPTKQTDAGSKKNSTFYWDEQGAKKYLLQNSKNDKNINLSFDHNSGLHKSSLSRDDGILEEGHVNEEKLSISSTDPMKSNCEIKRLELFQKIKENVSLNSFCSNNVLKTQTSADGYIHSHELQLEDGKFIEKSYACLKVLSPPRKKLRNQSLVRRTNSSVNLLNPENKVQNPGKRIQNLDSKIQNSTLDFVKSAYQHRYNSLSTPNIYIQRSSSNLTPISDEVKTCIKLPLTLDSIGKNGQSFENSKSSDVNEDQSNNSKEGCIPHRINNGRVTISKRVGTTASRLPKILIAKSNFTKEYQILNKDGRRTRNSSAKTNLNDDPDFQPFKGKSHKHSIIILRKPCLRS